MREDKRFAKQIRNCKIITDFVSYPESSVLIKMGNTKVICNVTVDKISANSKKTLDKGKLVVRYHSLHKHKKTLEEKKKTLEDKNSECIEIQNFIYSALSNCLDFSLITNYNIILECDVIENDGATKTASITGGFISIYLACQKLLNENLISKSPIKNLVSSISIGIINGKILLDLSYEEEKNTSVNMDIAMTDKNEIVGIHGIGKNSSFEVSALHKMVEFAQKGNFELIEFQKQVLNIV